MSNTKNNIKTWSDKAEKLLVGRNIVGVRYLNDEEMQSLGWTYRAPVLILDDGALILPSSDDEGNEAGALFTTYDELPTIPVI